MGLTFTGEDEGAAPGAGTSPARSRRSVSLAAARVTFALIAVNVVLFGLETLWGGSESAMTLYRMGASVGRSELASEPWRVLSSAFLHIGPLHLLVNMWALYVFGSALEALLDSTRVFVLYFVSALGGGLLSALAHDDRLSAGASGAVWGLMVGHIVLLLRIRQRLGPQAFPIRIMTLLQPLLVNLLISFAPGIDLFAHLGGGLAGGALMALLRLPLPREPGAERWVAVAGAVLMAASVGAALLNGRPWEAIERAEPRAMVILLTPAGADR
jgi:membrane associated rhomboid family serine protease